MADRRIDQLTESEEISDEDLFVIWKENISQTRSITMKTIIERINEIERHPHPDWGNVVSFTSSQLQAGYTAPADGVICISGHPAVNARGYISVNGNRIASGYASPTDGYRECQVQMIINKDDVIRTVGENNSGQAWSLHTTPLFVPWK